MAAKSVLNPAGIKSLRQFLQSELPVLQQAPILLVTSEPGADAVPLTPVNDASRLVQFTLSQQLGLRTVPASISSAFPSTQDLESRLDMLRRTGASSIVAVGSGAAMDLAKALARDEKAAIEQLILVPSTYGGAVASGTSHSLLLDTVEETLIPNPVGEHQPRCPTIVAPLDSKYTASIGPSSHVLYASLAIVFDAGLRKSGHPLLDGMVQDLYRFCVEDPTQEISHEALLDLCYRSGSLLSYGLGSEDRSSPLALASSLIPPIFPHVHILTFWASLLPGLCHALQSASSAGDPMQELATGVLANTDWSNIPTLAVADETMTGFSIPDMALSHIQANATVWKSFDLPNNVLTKILQQSLKK
jgi:hypothetical protein